MTLDLRTDGDTGAVITRRFAASPEAVFDAHIDPDTMRRWMLGPEGWKMTTCDSDARPGGKIHIVWEGPDGGGFSLTGEYVALDRPRRIEHVERMHLPDPTPDNRIVTVFEPDGDGTRLTMTMSLPSKEARDAMLATGMADGMEASYARLDGLSQPATYGSNR